MAALEEKLAEAVRQFPVLYDKSCRDLHGRMSLNKYDFRPVCITVLNTVSFVSFFVSKDHAVVYMVAVFSGFSS